MTWFAKEGTTRDATVPAAEVWEKGEYTAQGFRVLHWVDEVPTGLTQGNLTAVLAQQATFQGQAADQERAGRPVSKALIDKLDDLRDQQQRLDQDIKRYQATREQAESAFDQDRVRIQRLMAQ